jgi:cell division protein FtsB
MKKIRALTIDLLLMVVGFSLAVNLTNQVKTVITAKKLIANLSAKFDKLDKENKALEQRIKEVETPEERAKLYRQVVGW